MLLVNLEKIAGTAVQQNAQTTLAPTQVSGQVTHRQGLVFGETFSRLKDTSALAKKLALTINKTTLSPKGDGAGLIITISAANAEFFVNGRDELGDLILNDFRQRVVELNSKPGLKAIRATYNINTERGGAKSLVITLILFWIFELKKMVVGGCGVVDHVLTDGCQKHFHLKVASH